MRKLQTTDRSRLIAVSTVCVAVIALIMALSPLTVSAVLVEDRFVQLENPRPGDVGLHRVGFTITDFSQPIGSIRIQYCGNNPIIGEVCDPPDGFDASVVSIESQSGETDFDVHVDSDANNVILTRPPIVPTEADLRYELAEIVNPTTLGTFYARIFVYPTEDGSGPHTQAGGIALSTSVDVNVEAEVPPYLTFCAGVAIDGFDCDSIDSFFIDLGEFSDASTTTASSQILVATNAENGYATRIRGTTLTSGNNTIPALTSPSTSQIGASQFGLNLRNNTNPNVGANPSGPGTANPTANYNTPNQFMFEDNSAIANSPIPSSFRKFTISYITNIHGDQAPGRYSTTMSFITLANF
jgi:hypothetical protein